MSRPGAMKNEAVVASQVPPPRELHTARRNHAGRTLQEGHTACFRNVVGIGLMLAVGAQVLFSLASYRLRARHRPHPGDAAGFSNMTLQVRLCPSTVGLESFAAFFQVVDLVTLSSTCHFSLLQAQLMRAADAWSGLFQ